MERTWNNKAWFMVLPVLLLVAFSAVIPLMTVVNYSVQDTFGNNQFFWAGTDWFVEILHSDRFWEALGRNLLFSAIILSIEIPLGILIALNMPKKGLGVPVCLVLMALPLLIPWNVVGTIWQVFGRVDIGLLGFTLKALGFPTTMFTVLFAMGRLPGWIAHWLEMHRNPNTRICRPRQIYTGPAKRSFVPIDKRS